MLKLKFIPKIKPKTSRQERERIYMLENVILMHIYIESLQNQIYLDIVLFINYFFTINIS